MLAAYLELVRRAVVMAVPHPAEVAASMLEARHVHRSFHGWFFQLPELPKRAMLDPARGNPALEPLRALMQRPIVVPTLALCGAEDMRAELMRRQAGHFAGEYRYVEVADAGHFPQREQPGEVTRLLLDWLRPPRPAPCAAAAAP